jgi:hypothetical protein
LRVLLGGAAPFFVSRICASRIVGFQSARISIVKVVMIGRALRLGKALDRALLILSVLYRALLFAVLTILFGVLEHVIDGLLHRDDWATITRKLIDAGTYELFARMVMLFISFVPFFAFWEVGEAIGGQKLIEMFFAKRKPPMAKA